MSKLFESLKKKLNHSHHADEKEAHRMAPESADGLHDADSASVNGENSGDYDLSDPTAVELLFDDENSEELLEDVPEESSRSQQLQKVQKTLLSVEIARQKGVAFHGERICLPGRVPLSLFTLLEMLFGTIGFAAGFIHFAAMAKNFLLAQLVIYVLLMMSIFIYHSSYRAMRTFMTVLQTIGTFVIMALVGWAFYDLIVNPLPGVKHHLFLAIALVCFCLIPVAMFLHLVYFGRGYRYIELKRKLKASEKPTKILKTPSNTPTKII